MESLRAGDPELIGGYTCLARLGSGGMGQVFLARAEDGALVALKLVHADLAEDAAFHSRFAREVSAMRRVSGPYTAPLLDAGDSPRPWLATAYLPGLSLEEAVTRHGPLSADATHRLGAALAEALGSIHGAGVIHRDLKPSNILLTTDGPRVVDFGIAAGLGTGTSLGTVISLGTGMEFGTGAGFGTSDGSTAFPLGTPAYMAPEYLTGGPVAIPADIFALGGVLLFCHTGTPPFTTAPPNPPDQTARSHPAPNPLDRLDDENLRMVIAWCLAEDPSRRPTTNQLTSALSSPGAAGTGWLPAPMAVDIAEQATSLPGSIPTRPSDAKPTRRRVLLQISGVGIAALASMGTVRALTSTPFQTASVRWTARANAVTGYEVGPELDGRLFFLDRTVVTRSGAARVDLCCLDAATGRHRWRRPLTPFEQSDGTVVAASGSVWVRSRQALHLIDPDTGAVRWSQRRRPPRVEPAVAYGDSLVYDVAATDGEGGTVYAHEPRTGRVAWQRPIEGRPVGPIVVAEDTVYVMTVSARGRWERVHALNTANGAVRWVSGHNDDVIRMEPVAPRYTDASLCVADGTVYVSIEGHRVHALEARTGAARWRIRPQIIDDGNLPDPYPSAAFPVATGDTLLLGTGDAMLRAFDRRDGRQRWAVGTGAPPLAGDDVRRRFTPLVGDGLAFVRGTDSVRALQVKDGRISWERRTDPSAGDPVLAGGALHVPGTWDVTSHDPADGKVIQRLDLRDHRRAPRALIAGRDALYVLAGVDTLIAIEMPG
jgi:serine/threonine protein kinase/outer membrane protein assembly factor BamB